MIIIAHRGNTEGPRPELENKLEYIQHALDLGFDVEIDVWYLDGQFYLGHDGPETKIDKDYLKGERKWCHAKNIEALAEMIDSPLIHCFFHQNDDVTLTSCAWLWTFPGKKVCEEAVCVMPEICGMPDKCGAICTDYPIRYKQMEITG